MWFVEARKKKVISIREMRAGEFPGYKDYFIDEYATELVSNYGHSRERARNIAIAELEEKFPLGVSTPANHLNCIDLVENETATTVGYLWYANQSNDLSAFICDFYVFEEHRSKGKGKAVIEALENALAGAGIDQIKLRVAYDNRRALSFYKAVGFEITGYNMAKNIGD